MTISIAFTILILIVLVQIRNRLVYKLTHRELMICRATALALIQAEAPWEGVYAHIRRFNYLRELFDLTKWTHRQFFPESPIYQKPLTNDK